MIDALLYLLVLLIVAGLLFWAIKAALAAFGAPPQIAALVNIIFVVIVALAVLDLFFGSRTMVPWWRH